MYDRLERALARAVHHLTEGECPNRLAEALRYALFPPGHRFRPRLCLAVADGIGDARPWLTDAAAVALEFLHTASLIQDDLPAFDDAAVRRGRVSVHKKFGESIAVLSADALIIGAFEHIAMASSASPAIGQELALVLTRAAGTPAGAVAGQGWESEPIVNLDRYHRQKTGALFEAAAMAGAVAAGQTPEPWRDLGRLLGMAYQLADDIHDSGDDGGASHDVADLRFDRPNAARLRGAVATRADLHTLLLDAPDAVPPCTNRDRLRFFLDDMARGFSPGNVPASRRLCASGSRT